jgi:hypothetical protein
MKKLSILALSILAILAVGCGSGTPTAEGPKDANGAPAPVTNDPAAIGNAGETNKPPSGPNGEGLGQETPAAH